LAGANVIYGLGMLEMGITFDFGQLVMDNDFAGMIKHVVKGIRVTDETLAVDLIGEVGSRGDFLSHEHTFLHMKEMSEPRIIDRRRRDDWQSRGGLDMYQRAVEEARHILATHKPPQLPEGVQEEIRRIIAATEEELGIGRKGPGR
jgi:trimethylamine--corrinoid protein Co-methyltransferase